MLHIDIIAVGRLKNGPLFDLCAEYTGRMRWSVLIHEIESKKKTQDDEAEKILERLDPQKFLIILDEKGKSLKSTDFAEKLESLKNSGQNKIQFVIGGADGLTQAIRDKANLILSFGQQTWPHMLARAMLLEQIYRAEQIMVGHPYHRE